MKLLSMFMEKEDGDSEDRASMTRVVAWLFALVYCATLLLSAKTTATSMGWPFAALGIVVVLAVPLQALFKTLRTWLATPPGQKLLGTLIEKVASAPLAAATGGSTSTRTTVESTTETVPAPAPETPTPPDAGERGEL